MAKRAQRLASQKDIRKFLSVTPGDGPGRIEVRAVDPDDDQAVRRSFHPTLKAAAATIEEYARRRWNVFVGVARRTDEGGGGKKDLQATQVLWVDIDFHAEGDESRYRERIAEFSLPPTMIVATGGGLHLYWRLEEPLVLETQEVREKLERIIKGLAQELEGDPAATDCARVMRVAGTMNRLTPAKRASGRKPAMARIERIDRPRRYSLDAFEPYALYEDADPAIYKAPEVGARTIPHWLPPAVSDSRGRELFERRVDEPDQSRVDWLLGLHLARSGLAPEHVHHALELSRKLHLPAGADKKAGRVEYFQRTVDRVFAATKSTIVAEINRDHAAVMQGGRAIVLRERRDPDTGYLALEFCTHQAIREHFANRRVRVAKNKSLGAGQLWLAHPQRRSYDGLIFAPGRAPDERYYNLWQGFSVQPRRGECGLFWEHVEQNICRGDPELFLWLQAWMAFTVQHLSEIPGTAVVLCGGQGTGKGVFARTLGHLLGPHYVHITTSDGLTRNFNAHLLNTRLVFADEAFWAGDKRGLGHLKALITEPTLQLEMKHRDAFTIPNHLVVIMASNNEWVVPAGADERRFAVFNIGEGRKQDRDYFRALIAQLEDGGYAALLDDLLSFDLEGCGVDPQVVPRTQGLLEQKIRSLPAVEAWWYDELQAASLLGWAKRKATVPTASLYARYRIFAEDHGHSRDLLGKEAFGKTLHQLAPGLKRAQRQKKIGAGGARRERVYVLPPLKSCRSAFEEHLGQAIDWESGF